MKNLFFDLDGTLVDSLPGIEYAVDSALAQMSIVRRESLKPLIGPPIRSILRTVAAGAGEDQLDRLEKAFRAVYDSTGWRKTTLQRGVVPALDELGRAGLRLFVVTNKPAAAAEKILKLLQLWERFEEVVARDSRVPGFPDKAEMIRFLMERHGLDAAECLMVGDTAEDYAAAAEAGVAAVIMAHGYGEAEPGMTGSLLHNFAQLTSLCVEHQGIL